MPDDLEIRAVEIFKAGTWNADTYDVADLDDIIAAFEQLDFRPPLKLGHGEGKRAVGFVKRLWRSGTSLFADLAGIPQAVYEEIKQGAWPGRSVEVMWGLERLGRKFRRALTALAFVGGDLPAVAGLAPIELAGARFDAMRVYVMFNRLEVNLMESDRPDEEVSARIAAHAAVHQLDISTAAAWQKAREAVLLADAALARAYAFRERRRGV